MTKAEPRAQFDHVVVTCKGCSGKRDFYPDRAFEGAQELIEFMKNIPACACGAKRCDVKAFVKNPEVLRQS